MRRSFRLFAATIFSFTILAATTQPVFALSGLTISPPLRDVTLGPGLLETSAELTLQNNTDQAVRASLRLADLRALGQYGGNSLDKAGGLAGKYDLANWISLPDGDTVTIASKQTVTVKVKIVNRSDLSPGGHYGAIIVTTSPSKTTTQSNVSLNQQLVSLLFIKKLGGENYGLQLASSDFKKSGGIVNELKTTFKNTGNVHVVPRGYVEVTDPTGQVVSKGIINQDSAIILPDSSRQYVTLMQSVAPYGKSGIYNVTTYYRYDDKQDFTEYTQTFRRGRTYGWLLLVAGVSIVGSALVMFYVLNKKRLRKSA